MIRMNTYAGTLRGRTTYEDYVDCEDYEDTDDYDSLSSGNWGNLPERVWTPYTQSSHEAMERRESQVTEELVYGFSKGG